MQNSMKWEKFVINSKQLMSWQTFGVTLTNKQKEKQHRYYPWTYNELWTQLVQISQTYWFLFILNVQSVNLFILVHFDPPSPQTAIEGKAHDYKL